jgi:hypothetical protein
MRTESKAVTGEGEIGIMAFEINQAQKEERLSQLNLVYYNYLVEVAALQAKLEKNRDDIVRQARLKLIQENLIPKVCDLILHLGA